MRHNTMMAAKGTGKGAGRTSFAAKYAGACVGCGLTYKVGQTISRLEHPVYNDMYQYFHLPCAERELRSRRGV